MNVAKEKVEHLRKILEELIKPEHFGEEFESAASNKNQDKNLVAIGKQLKRIRKIEQELMGLNDLGISMQRRLDKSK